MFSDLFDGNTSVKKSPRKKNRLQKQNGSNKNETMIGDSPKASTSLGKSVVKRVRPDLRRTPRKGKTMEIISSGDDDNAVAGKSSKKIPTGRIRTPQIKNRNRRIADNDDEKSFSPPQNFNSVSDVFSKYFFIKKCIL